MFTKCFDVRGRFYEIGSRVKDNGFSQHVNEINPSNKAWKLDFYIFFREKWIYKFVATFIWAETSFILSRLGGILLVHTPQ